MNKQQWMTTVLRGEWDFLRFRLYQVIKRTFDLVVTCMALLLLSPLFLAVAAIIKCTSQGPVFYTQTRIGRLGKTFQFIKFRSMYTAEQQANMSIELNNESPDNVLFKMKKDPRVTTIGRFIRRFSIDELPQLFNVLRGDMSLVGPRPCLPTELEQYSHLDRQRLVVEQGITGLWQVSGRSDLSFSEQIQLDLSYIRHRSFWNDLRIIFRTFGAVVSGKGAY